jgi:hypothetical protein
MEGEMKFRFPRFKWRLQFSLLALFGVMTAVAVGFGIAPTIRVQLAVWALSNKDVEVSGGYGGLAVEIHSPSAEQLKNIGESANWALERALADPERFAAAHVLLTEINQVPKGGSASHWNGMKISLWAYRPTDFHAEQIPKLQEYWRNRLGKHQPGEEEGQMTTAVAPSG